MEKMYVNEIVSAVNGELLSGFDGTAVNSVSTNSKELSDGALFVPIKGEKFNGHDFIESAFKAGAVATLTSEHDAVNSDKVYIKVKDTQVALQQLAAYYRQKFDIPVVGITGSVGKTSTKEMIASVLSAKFNVHKTQGNLNGQLGLPLTILGLESQHEIAVVEMGVSELGEMDTLSQIAMPSHSVMTNIGVAHIENLHTRENIFAEKFKITKFLRDSGYLFINGDDDILCKTQDGYDFNVISCGIKNSCTFTAKNISCDDDTTTFEVLQAEKCLKFTITTIGEHHVYNALIAIAIGFSLGMNADEIQSGLLKFTNLQMRQNICRLGEITLIDDCYNANPDSMKSALKVLAQISKKGRKIAVLADMLELGEMAESLHFEVGRFAAELGVDIVITVGKLAMFIAEGAAKNNKNIQAFAFNTNKSAAEFLNIILMNGDAVLVKGSRGMHLEEICKEIVIAHKK